MKPSAPTPQHQSEPDSSIPMPVWSDIDCDDIPDIEAKNAGAHLPGIRPADELRVMDRASALREVPNCLVSCDHIPRRSMPLFRAKAVLDELIAGFPPRSPSHRSTSSGRSTA